MKNYVLLFALALLLQCGCRCLYSWEKVVKDDKSASKMSSYEYYSHYYALFTNGNGCGKRDEAIMLARKNVAYVFKDHKHERIICFYFDGVSNFIYNLAYLGEGIKKIILSPLYSTGPIDFIINIFVNIFGMLMSIIMLIIGTLLGTLCHPLETLANLTINIFSTIWCILSVLFTSVLGLFYALWHLIWEPLVYLLKSAWSLFIILFILGIIIFWPDGDGGGGGRRRVKKYIVFEIEE